MNSAIVEFFKKYDFTFFGTMTAIFIIGFINLYSATHAKPVIGGMPIYIKQLVFYLIAVGLGFGVSLIHTKNLFKWSYAIYGFNIFILILVLFAGDKSMGARRWLSIGGVSLGQPSELMKISVVLALARWFTRHDPDKEIGFKELILPGIIVGIPAILVIKQPDLGTGLILLLIFLVMTFYRRLKLKVIAVLALMALIIGPIMYKFVLKDYQRQRILTFLDPGADERGTGYNIKQSEIAIGSGQIFGKGFKNSSQASLSYLPENHTDFVFSVFNEEHGFFGSFVLITLFVIFFLRMIWLSTNVLKFYDSICVIGLMSIFFWHTFINMCMVTRLMPIVGLPLPFMSYGGSSLMTFGIAIGIMTSISNAKKIF